MISTIQLQQYPDNDLPKVFIQIQRPRTLSICELEFLHVQKNICLHMRRSHTGQCIGTIENNVSIFERNIVFKWIEILFVVKKSLSV